MSDEWFTRWGATRDRDGAWTFLDAATEVGFVSGTQACVAPLSALRRATFIGDDARTFLQGQLTNDVFALEPGYGQWQGYCQPQGRLLATFPLVCEGPGQYWIALPTSIAEAVVRRLSMYVLRARVKIAVTEDWVFGGIRMTAAPFVRVGAELSVAYVPTAQLDGRWNEWTKAAIPISEGRWRWAAAQTGVSIIDAGAQELFVPQMIGWDTVGVSFKKGCYPGQEVVARAHYRGAVKRRPVHLAGHSIRLPSPGTALILEGDEVGHLVAAQRTGDTAWSGIAAIHQDFIMPGEKNFVGLGPCVVTPR